MEDEEPLKTLKPFKEKPLRHLLGGIATCGACIISNPFEVVKTRMQLQGELQLTAAGVSSSKKLYRNVFHGLGLIYMKEGFAGIQKGLVPALAYQFVMNGLRLGTYEPLQEILKDFDLFAKSPFSRSIFAGALCGAFGAFIGSPFYLVKIQLQSYSSQKSNPGKAGSFSAPTSSLAVGTQHAHRGVLDAFRNIYSSGGISALYQGYRAAVVRVAVGSATQLGSYDFIKSKVLEHSNLSHDSFYTHIFSSVFTSFVVVLCMNPFDVVTTRIYNQKIGKNGVGELYSSLWNCVYKMATFEGYRSFYKGITAHYVRLGPHTVLTFIFWEQLKKLSSRFE